MHSGERYSLPFTLLAFTLRHKMTDSVLSISACFVQLRIPAVLPAVPNSTTEGQHLEELAGSLPFPLGSSSLPHSHLGRASQRDEPGEKRREEKRERGKSREEKTMELG